MVILRIKYWYYRTMPWFIKCKIHLDDSNYFKLGDIVESTIHYGQYPNLYKSWVYCGNNTIVLLKTKLKCG